MPRRSGGMANPGPATVRSPIRTSPASAAWKPATTRNSVVLPHPEAPRIAVVDPPSTVRPTSCSTSVVP